IACDSYTWIDGNTYTTSNNTATFNFPGGAANGCDSLVTLDLTINTSNSIVLSETFDSATITGANGPVLYGNGGSDFNASYALSGTFFGWFNVQNGIGDVDIYDINVPGLNPGCTVTASIWMRMSFNAPNVSISLIDDNGIVMDSINLTLTTSWQQITLTAPVSTNGLNYLVHYNSTGGNGLDVIMEDLLITQSCGINAEISQVSDQCLSGNNFNFDGSASTGSGGISSYTWDFGDTSANGSGSTTNHIYSSAGNYNLNLTVSDGICTDDTTININVIQNPIASSPSDVIECNAYILPSLANGNYFSQSNGLGNNYSSGAYFSTSQTLYVYAESGTTPNCFDENSFTITINNSATGNDSQSACGSYTWIDGNTYTASNNIATYNITGGAANGCDSLVTLNLTINNVINSTDFQSACESYTWIDGNTYTASNNTATYTIFGGAASGCDSIVTLNLIVNNNSSSTDIQIACDSYTWIDGITYTSDNNTATYTLSSAAGCDSLVSLDLTINALTGLDAGTDIYECEGNEVSLLASGANTYSWNNGISNGSVITINEGITIYTVIGQDLNGCSSEDDIIITGWANPSISSLPINPFCIGENSGSIEIEIDSGSPPFSISWNNGDTTTLIQNLYTDTYDVTVIDNNGCLSSSSVSLNEPYEPCYEEPEVNIFIPNSFSPDENEHNQTWFVVAEGISVQNFTLMIFNRWGEIIWKSHDIRVGWDGTYNNKNVPDGTYTYKLEYQEQGGDQKKSQTGHMNLLR
ncbi:MAG: T9SS type B sorting domain-containing protein, partial [Flavobacteriales bacterium]|nr:T9SS type B sorting domain-containing protein [Flavobacteriales bacterium]